MKTSNLNLTFSSFTKLFFVFSFIACWQFQAKACIDPDTIPTLVMNYSEDFSEVEIRIGNLRLGTESPNTFCSCALSAESQVFTYVTYFAVVDSNTNDIYPNFEPFVQSEAADAAWDASQPFFPGWNGFIAEVINSGLSFEHSVEFVIRAQAPPGVLVELGGSTQDSTGFYNTTFLGTDMWDPTNETIAEDHQAVRSFNSFSSIEANVMPMSYFAQLDANFITATKEPESIIEKVILSPNPSQDYTRVSFLMEEKSNVSLELFSSDGKAIRREDLGYLASGRQEYSIRLAGLAEGIYYLKLNTEKGSYSTSFIKH
ncbi:MAG: T9SS type A sorting domain-containing protein [Bacteroidota bacterium]